MNSMREIKYYCDECEKEIWDSQAVTVTLFVQKGIQEEHSKFSMERFNERHWKSKEIYNSIICKECTGTEVNTYSNEEFYLKDAGKSLIRKLLNKLFKQN